MIKSHGGNSARCRRKYSRAKRRMRLRCVAAGIFFLAIAKPRRAKRKPFGLAKTVKPAAEWRCACANTNSNSAGCSSRAAFGKAKAAMTSRLYAVIKPLNAYGLWRDGVATPSDRFWWPCEHGNRGHVYASGCLVEMYVSCLLSTKPSSKITRERSLRHTPSRDDRAGKRARILL